MKLLLSSHNKIKEQIWFYVLVVHCVHKWHSSRSIDSIVCRNEICETFPFTSYHLYFRLTFSLKKNKASNARTGLIQAQCLACEDTSKEHVFSSMNFVSGKGDCLSVSEPIWHFWWHVHPSVVSLLECSTPADRWKILF